MTIQVPLRKSRFNSSVVQPLFNLITFVIQVLLLLLVFFQGSQLNQLANSAANTMVQMIDGQVIQISPAQADYRSDLVIQNLVNQWAMLTYTWSGNLPPTNIESAKSLVKDPGVIIGKFKVPTATVNAAFLITDKNDFRRKFLAGIGALVPQGVFQGEQQTALRISQILQPQQLKAGRWDVNLYGYLEVFERGDTVGSPIEIKRKITLQAVPPPNYPMPNNLSPLQQTIYRLGAAGLMIEQIEELPS